MTPLFKTIYLLMTYNLLLASSEREVSLPKTSGIPVMCFLRAQRHGGIISPPAFCSPFPCFSWAASVLEDPGSAAPNEISMQMTHFDFSVNHHCKCQAHYSQILQGVVTSISASRERRFLKGAAWVLNNAALGCFLICLVRKNKQKNPSYC